MMSASTVQMLVLGTQLIGIGLVVIFLTAATLHFADWMAKRRKDR